MGQWKNQVDSKTSLESSEPWGRFPHGLEFAKALERGRAQDALWLLDDGLLAPRCLLSQALCGAAAQGLGLVCRELLARGAGFEHRAFLGEGILAETRSQACFSGSAPPEAPHGPAMLALLGGHVDLGLDLAALDGQTWTPLDYALLSMAGQARGAPKTKAMRWARRRLDSRGQAWAANFMCVAGRLDDALELLEASGEIDKALVARSMLAPLCAYAPTDPQLEESWIVLESAARSSAPRSARSVAPWSILDQRLLETRALSSGSRRPARLAAAMDLANKISAMGCSRLGRDYEAWPRVAAAMNGNSTALALMSALEWGRGEAASLRSSADAVLALLDRQAPAPQWPSLFGAGKGWAVFADEPQTLAWRSRAQWAIALADARSIEESSIEGAKRFKLRMEKERKRSGSPREAPVEGAKKTRRL